MAVADLLLQKSWILQPSIFISDQWNGEFGTKLSFHLFKFILETEFCANFFLQGNKKYLSN